MNLKKLNIHLFRYDNNNIKMGLLHSKHKNALVIYEIDVFTHIVTVLKVKEFSLPHNDASECNTSCTCNMKDYTYIQRICQYMPKIIKYMASYNSKNYLSIAIIIQDTLIIPDFKLDLIAGNIPLCTSYNKVEMIRCVVSKKLYKDETTLNLPDKDDNKLNIFCKQRNLERWIDQVEDNQDLSIKTVQDILTKKRHCSLYKKNS